MQGGRIVEVGYTEDVFRDPQHPYTRQLLVAVKDMGVRATTRGMAL
jgi:peptide/nickel transport system ATP-binding protein